jgi:septum formation protein
VNSSVGAPIAVPGILLWKKRCSAVSEFHRSIKKMKLILASSSPRRRDILKQIGLDYEPLDINVDETIDPVVSPERLALDIAKRKAIAASATSGDAVIIAADTIVVLEDGTVLGKPQDGPEAVRMLERLQGAKHTVITAIALYSGVDGKLVAAYDKADVTFLPMSGAEIDWYVSTGEPLDKAGAYGLQEKGMLFVQKIEGSPSSVIGLPVHLLYQLFEKAGLDILSFINK